MHVQQHCIRLVSLITTASSLLLEYQVFSGNLNGTMVVTRVLAGKPTARFIRFYPLNWTEDVCMRVSVYGCRDPTLLSPVASVKEELDETFWALLWALLGLLLLLLLLGLLYLCCRYCPCRACCPCAKKRKAKRADETMMTDLTSDEIDAGRSQYATQNTQTGAALPQTETQTVAMHFNDEGRRHGDVGETSFSGQERVGSSIGRYNDGFDVGDGRDRIASSHLGSSGYREATSTAGTIKSPSAGSFSEVGSTRDGRQTTSRKHLARDRMTSSYNHRTTSSYDRDMLSPYNESISSSRNKMASSEYNRANKKSSEYNKQEHTRSRDVSRTERGQGGRYVGRYDVEALYPGQTSSRQPPLLPPPLIEMEVSPDYEDNSWKVDRIERVDDLLAMERSRQHAEQSKQQYQGVRFGGMGVSQEGFDNRGFGDGTTTIKVHLGNPRPRASQVESRTMREQYYRNEDTLQARPRREVETWKIDSIRGGAIEKEVDDEEIRARVIGPPYLAPDSPTPSDVSSISEQFGGNGSKSHSSKKEKFYKMFEYYRN